MPRPPRPWFRFYSEALTNLKLHAMPDRLVKPWLFLLCLASEHEPRGSLPTIPRIAFALRVKEDRAKTILADLMNLRLVDYIDDHYVMHEWDEWQRDSDARRGSSAAKPPQNDGITATVVQELCSLEEEIEEIKKTEEEKRAEEDARPPEHPFAFMYAQRYRSREGRPLPPQVHAACLALEREFGSQPCIEVAGDYDWQKHPNYLIPVLKERRDGKPTTTGVKATKFAPGRSAGGGAVSGDFGLDDWKQYDADRPRSPATAAT